MTRFDATDLPAKDRHPLMNHPADTPIRRLARSMSLGWLVVGVLAAALLGGGLVGCQSARLGDEPVVIEPAALPPGVREAYTTLSAPGGYLDERTAAVVALIEDGSDEAAQVVAWAMEQARPREVNQAVLQGVTSAPGAPDKELWWPIFLRADTLAPGLEEDFALALAKFEGPKFTQQLVKLAESGEAYIVGRQRAITALGQRRNKPVAEVLLGLTSTTKPPAIRQSAFTALGTLAVRPDLGEDRQAWRQWWDESKGLDAAAWERQLSRNFARRDATDEISSDQLVDRLVELNTTLYRMAQDKDKPRVLADLLTESMLPLRGLGMTLSEQRLSAGGGFSEALRAALRENLVAEESDLRLRAATLLRDLADEPAADLVAGRLAEREENVDAVLRSYLVLMARMPRAEAVDPAQGLLQDRALQPQAAAALAEAGRAGLLTDGRAARIAKDVRAILDANGPRPDPQLVTLLGRVGSDRDFERIAAGLDHPDTTIRRAAAQAWADSDRSLVILAERADDPVIQPIVITAAEQRGQDPQTLRTLALFPPTPGPTRDAWERALVAMSEGVSQAQTLAATQALRDPSFSVLRESMLTAALDTQPADAEPGAAYLALLLERGELRLQTERPRVAILDFQGLVPHSDRLTADQLDRLHRGLIRSALLTSQLKTAVRVTRQLFNGPNEVLIQPASDDPIIDLFIETAAEHVSQGRRTQGIQVLDELRLLLGPKMRPQIAVRMSNVETQTNAAAGNGRRAPSPGAESAASNGPPDAQP